ncbi:hypothetical protein DF016_10770 [Burkholderia stagnalis]|uniref:DUF305 domain-containing protein n=2 Tax=Burkholderia stagnalis TaxID=1503054 RepID=A0ABX9YQH8_9BURK|nr:hypothetical protein DF017_12350 [Burkholderia stagnalis]RQZ19539.1 hypothetical protein DF016_10770 [Burkholderia stagnalis]
MESHMNASLVRTVVVSALLVTASAVSFAATGSNPGHSKQDQQQGQGSMMMGMGGMMGSCPMMGASAGMDPKTAMRMHAEMMRAMSDIMLKYSDQAGSAPSK